MGGFTSQDRKQKTLDINDIESFSTDPWANAEKAPLDIVDHISYPDLKGLEVMLINPNSYYRKKLLGLGLAYVATSMQRCGINVHLMDCSAWSHDDIEVAKELIQSKVKIFGIGGMYPNFKEVERLCGLIRAVVPGATIILGGALPTPIPEFVLRKTKADICTIGEAEMTIPKLMGALANNESLEGIKGIAYIKDGEFFHNGNPHLPTQVTKKEVGLPALELFPLEHYFHSPKPHPFSQFDRNLPIVTGRGCPYACNFCYRVSAYRFRPVDEVMDEMGYMIDRYKVNSFYFEDDLFMLSHQKMRDFCEGIINRGYKVKYNCSGRVNTVNREIAQLMKESGCVAVYYGIESGSQEILNNMSKKTNLEQIYEAIRLTREQGIFCEYGFIYGEPNDNEQTMADTVKLVKNISSGEYRPQKIFGCVPFPGSGLYDWCKETGRIQDDQAFYDRYVCQDWSLDQLPVNMTTMSDEKINKVFKDANDNLSQFYLEKMSSDWVQHFGGAKENSEDVCKDPEAMRHLRTRVESSLNTFDISGRT
ncbi:MAG: B12-binding domain-containing radical SAM protein [Nitrospina sp.]|nr:B12-binding domain-containing radical SAM protein [Nitrospina sp.]